MPENVNVSALDCGSSVASSDNSQVMIDIDHVSMIFNMASEQLNNLKEYFIALAKHELRFKEFRALDDVSIQVNKGDVFGILGTNGSGKSTLLKIIAGVLEPSKGACTVNGNIAPLIELGAGFDFELTARENIYLNGALLGYSRKYIDDHFDEIVEFAEVEKFLDMPMKNYSSGMVARIAFAIATVIVPEILIVDEVLSVGDFMFQKKCEDRIMSLINEHNVTVLIVSHNNDQIERLCNKAVWIEKGHLRMQGTAKEVCDVYRVLGGRIGSGESEKAVLDAFKDTTPVPKGRIETLAADSRYGMASRIAERCYPAGSSTVIVAPGEQIQDVLMAEGLAGALDAPVLLVQDDNIPDVTVQTLERLKPSEFVVVGKGEAWARNAAKELAQVFGDDSIDFNYVCAEGYPQLSLKILEFGTERNAWGTDIVYTFEGCTGDVVSMSPYFVNKKAPVVIWSSDGAVQSEIAHSLCKFGFKRVLAFGPKTLLPDEFVHALADGDVEASRFEGLDHYDANIKINAWIDEQHLDVPACDKLIISPIWNTEDCYLAGILANKLGARIVFDDPQDLDSVSAALNYIKDHKQIRTLLFVSERSRYTDTDKAILARAIVG